MHWWLGCLIPASSQSIRRLASSTHRHLACTCSQLALNPAIACTAPRQNQAQGWCADWGFPPGAVYTNTNTQASQPHCGRISSRCSINRQRRERVRHQAACPQGLLEAKCFLCARRCPPGLYLCRHQQDASTPKPPGRQGWQRPPEGCIQHQVRLRPASRHLPGRDRPLGQVGAPPTSRPDAVSGAAGVRDGDDRAGWHAKGEGHTRDNCKGYL